MERILVSCENVGIDLPVKATRPSYAVKAFASAFTGGTLKVTIEVHMLEL